jgi:hypothetical protein
MPRMVFRIGIILPNRVRDLVGGDARAEDWPRSHRRAYAEPYS